MTNERNRDGQFTPDVTLEDVLAVFDEVEGPVVTSGDVTDALDCSGETARRKLTELYHHGELARRKTAGRVIYWRKNGPEPNSVDPDDPFFTDYPTFASGNENLSERVDELLYGKNR